jgi:hypothetical protein
MAFSSAEPTFLASGSTADFFVAVAAAMNFPLAEARSERKDKVVRIAGNSRKKPPFPLDFGQSPDRDRALFNALVAIVHGPRRHAEIASASLRTERGAEPSALLLIVMNTSRSAAAA